MMTIPTDPASTTKSFKFEAVNYDLANTLSCGQAFRWRETSRGWIGVIEGNWVCLRSDGNFIHAEVATTRVEPRLLVEYLQTEADLPAILATFPPHSALQRAVRACWGLRLLRQPPWECLASFILSSTKQITQIRQIVEMLCGAYGATVTVPPGEAPAFAFPSASRIAECSEAELRACKMGFRAPYLRAVAQAVASGACDLQRLRMLPLSEARSLLMNLAGVGGKIADCVLLFAYGFPTAFPVDVWVARILRREFFPRRKLSLPRLQALAQQRFGAHAGYAQQYLFHHVRMQEAEKRFHRAAPIGKLRHGIAA